MNRARRAAFSLGRVAIAAVVLLFTRRRSKPDSRSEQPRPVPASETAELWVAGLLAAAGLAGAAFVAAYAAGGNTQLLGIASALGFGLLGVALIVASHTLVVDADESEERPEFANPGAVPPEEAKDVAATGQALREGGRPVSRRKLLIAASGAAGLGVGAAALTPLASLGPRVGDHLTGTPWRDGVALWNENELPVRAEDLAVGSFVTAFAARADRADPKSAVMVVRVRTEELELPEGRADWAPGGFLAFSKVCTHAGCAVSLFRYPLSPSTTEAGPALVCPCHYSTFDVLRGGERIFGPAVRALPQLPLRITEEGTLVAAGELSGPPGPSWSGIEASS